VICQLCGNDAPCATHDVDRFVDELFGVEPSDHQPVDNDPGETLVTALLQHVDRSRVRKYRKWWLDRYTMEEIRMLGGPLEHL
jgi:hypothetical protein